MDVKKEPEVLLVFVLGMEVVVDVRNLIVKKGQRDEPLTVNPMVVVEDVTTWDAQKVQKDIQITVLLMVVVEGVVTRLAPVLHEGNLACVYVMGVERDVR